MHQGYGKTDAHAGFEGGNSARPGTGDWQATAVIGRSAPSLNLFSLGLPAGVLAGLAALIAAAPLVADRSAELSLTAIEQAAKLIAP